MKKYDPENMIKGRIAEALIEELFLSLGYNVFRYGMENTVPGVIKLLKGIKVDVAEQIRSMPDLVVQHTDHKDKIYFIEVKFRKDGIFEYSELLNKKKEYPYANAFVVLVSKKHIKCASVTDLDNGKIIKPGPEDYLADCEAFQFDNNDREKIKDFCNFAVKFFENVD